MTLREEFEEYVNSWNKLSTEKLFASSNKEYIKWLEDQYDNYKCDEASLDDFSKYDLVRELKDRGFDFIEEVNDQDMIHYLESVGCSIVDENDTDNDYDYVDDCLFEDIVSVFDSLSCAKRQELRDLIINFK